MHLGLLSLAVRVRRVGDAAPLAAYGCGHDTGWSDVAVQSGILQGIRFWLQVICNQDLRRHRQHRFTSSFHLHGARSAVLHRGRRFSFPHCILSLSLFFFFFLFDKKRLRYLSRPPPPCCGTHAGLIVRRPSLCPLLSPIPPPPHTHNTEFTEHSRSSTTLPRPLPRLSRLSQS